MPQLIVGLYHRNANSADSSALSNTLSNALAAPVGVRQGRCDRRWQIEKILLTEPQNPHK